MGKVESFNLDGLDLFFNSHDHLPPHFHVRKPGQGEIRVFFLLCNQENGLNFGVADFGYESLHLHFLKLRLKLTF